MDARLDKLSPHPRASLLGLPAELRIHIYTLLLEHTHLKLRHRMSFRGHKVRNAWASLQVCHTIRREIRRTFFSTVTWEFHDGFTEQKLRAWMGVVGEAAVAHLRHLRFFCKSRCSNYGLSPDEDYCHRQAAVDIRPDWGKLGNYSMDGKACSNHANSCEKMSSFALINACRRLVTGVDEDVLVDIWRALNKDNSPVWEWDYSPSP